MRQEEERHKSVSVSIIMRKDINNYVVRTPYSCRILYPYKQTAGFTV